jgi:hypothetical protein
MAGHYDRSTKSRSDSERGFLLSVVVGEPNNKFVKMLGRFGVQAFAGDDLK